MRECHCLPWDMIRNDTNYDFELCDRGGNHCFWNTIENYLVDGVIMDKECFCLSDCESTKYDHSVILKPFELDDCATDWEELSLIPFALLQQRALVWSQTKITPFKNVTNLSELENKVMNGYYSKLCISMKTNDMVSVRLRLEGPSFTTMKRSLKDTFTDKLGSVGGTLGLFSGFSLLAIVELMHWICRIFNSLITSQK